MAKGNYLSALSFFERALVLTPNYPRLEINLGVVNAAMADQMTGDAATSRTLAAQRHFERAIALDPRADEPHAFYGRWLEQLGRLPEAREQLETAVAANPLRLMQRDLLIATCEAEGDDGAARRAARETLSIAPDDDAAKALLAQP